MVNSPLLSLIISIAVVWMAAHHQQMNPKTEGEKKKQQFSPTSPTQGQKEDESERQEAVHHHPYMVLLHPTPPELDRDRPDRITDLFFHSSISLSKAIV